jgi:hypothetical protein
MRLFFENVDSSFGECRRDNESWHISLLYPSTLFPYSFLHSFAAVTELWCSWFFGSRVWVLKNGGFSSFLRGTLESILQRRGLAYFDISKWPAVQINANRWFFRFRSRMTDISGDVCALHQYALYDSAGVFSRSCCLRLLVSFDTSKGPLSSRRMLLPLLGLAENATARQVCAWWAIKQVAAGLAGGGVKGLCGRHSKDPYKTAGFGSVERVTEGTT